MLQHKLVELWNESNCANKLSRSEIFVPPYEWVLISKLKTGSLRQKDVLKTG